MLEWTDLIKPELLILIPFLYGVGFLIKKAPHIKDWLIPLILWGISIVVTTLYLTVNVDRAFTGSAVLSGILQGTFIALSTVGGNELLKQIFVKRKEDNAAADAPKNDTEMAEKKDTKDTPIDKTSGS